MKEIDTIDQFKAQLETTLEDCVVQNLDLSSFESKILTTPVAGAVFLGCTFTEAVQRYFDQNKALTFPTIPGLVFNPYRSSLYTARDLYDGFDQADPNSYKRTPDSKIYEYWKKNKDDLGVFEALLQRMHDHAIDDAIGDFTRQNNIDSYKMVAIMGGHKMVRGAEDYRTVAKLSWLLCREGYLVVSGGGPGAMEASHLGPLFANGTLAEMDAAITELSNVPGFESGLHPWLSSAFKLLDEVSQKYQPAASLAIPTWLYGHEPSTPFATHIAKYFANSIREDGLVTLAKGGIIFSPGKAGTIQEIFQDAAQNYYMSNGEASPMIFLGTEYWACAKPIYPFLKKLARDENKPYAKLICLLDDPEEIVDYLKTHPPIKAL